MLRSSLAVTRLVKVRNENIRGTTQGEPSEWNEFWGGMVDILLKQCWRQSYQSEEEEEDQEKTHGCSEEGDARDKVGLPLVTAEEEKLQSMMYAS